MVASAARKKEWQKLVTQWRASGLSQRAFALEHGVTQKQISLLCPLVNSMQRSRFYFPTEASVISSLAPSALGRNRPGSDRLISAKSGHS